LSHEEKVHRWSGGSGGLGLGLASHVQSGVEQEEVGDKVHHMGNLPTERIFPQLVEAIVGGLQGWYSGANLQSFSKQPAFIQQCDLGWNMFLEGGLSRLWKQEQDDFWKRVKSHKSSKRWTSELIKKLWGVS